MPRVAEPLTASRVRALRDAGRYTDQNGLSLHVFEAGSRTWEWRGTLKGKRIVIVIGPATLFTLAEAREKAREYRQQARVGIDPRPRRSGPMTFEKAARAVHGELIADHSRNAKHSAQWLTTLETYAFPHLGKMPVGDITQADIHTVLLPIWTTIPESARRVKQRISSVMDWSIAKGHRETINPVAGVQKALPRQSKAKGHFAALDWQELPAFMRRLEAADGMGARALRFAILTAARSGEVRGATWGELDLPAKRWTIPAERMKAGRAHVVPLSDAAIAALPVSVPTTDGLVFPSSRSGAPLSDMTLTAVLRRLKVNVTAHGFRSSFRTWCEESTNYPRSVVETALSHSASENAVEKAYLRSDLYVKRIGLMNDWAKLLA